MKSKRAGLALAILAVICLVGAIVAGSWSAKTEYGTGCGSYLSSSDSAYQDAYQRNMGMMGSAAYDTGSYSESDLGLPTGAFDVVARKMANEEVARCDEARQSTGIIAGMVLLAAVIAGIAAVFLLVRNGRPSKTPRPGATA